jgi:outer membrane protein TolC
MVLLTSFFNVFSGDSTQVIEKITVEKALKIAFENSPYLKAIEHEKNTYKTYKEEAKSYKMPNIDLMSGYIKTNSPGDVFWLQLSKEEFSLMDFSMTDPNHPAPYSDYFTTLKVSQILYAGGQIKNGIKQGKAMSEAGDFKYKRALQQVEFNTVSAYLNVILASKYTKLMENVVKTVKAHVTQAKAYFDTGFIMEADYLQAQVVLSEMERKKMSAENNLRLAKAYFNNVIGVDQSTVYTFENNFTYNEKNFDLNKLLDIAIENRPDYKELSLKVEASKHQIAIEKSDYKPKVMLVGEVNYHDSTLFGSDASSYKLMAVAKINVFNGKKTRIKIGRAKEQYYTYKNYQKQMEEGVKLQVKQAYFNLQDAKKQYETASLAEKQALQNLTLREERYKSGVERTTDLLTADTEYLKASTAKLHALFNYLKAYENLKFMTGTKNI